MGYPLPDGEYALHDVRAVGVGPAVHGRSGRREGVRELLVIRSERGIYARGLVVERHVERGRLRRRWRRYGPGHLVVDRHAVGRESSFEHRRGRTSAIGRRVR